MKSSGSPASRLVAVEGLEGAAEDDPAKVPEHGEGVFAWLVFMVVRRCLPCSCPSRPLFHALHRRRVGHWPPFAVTPDQEYANERSSGIAARQRSGTRQARYRWSRQAVLTDAIGAQPETPPQDHRGRQGDDRRDQRRRPRWSRVAKRADVSVRSVFQHFGDVESLFVTVVDSVRGDLVVPPPTVEQPAAVRIRIAIGGRQSGADLRQDRAAAGRGRAVRQSSGAARARPGVARRVARRPLSRCSRRNSPLLSEPAREELADAIGAALSLDAWIVLRRRDGLSFERATRGVAPDADGAAGPRLRRRRGR